MRQEKLSREVLQATEARCAEQVMVVMAMMVVMVMMVIGMIHTMINYGD